MPPLDGRLRMNGYLRWLAIGAFACGFAANAYALDNSHPELKTTAEKSGNQRTGRYDEVERLCTAFQQAWPQQVRCFTFGKTPEGRPMLALAASADGVLDPAA